jgi:glucose/arabinose dehydrogenase
MSIHATQRAHGAFTVFAVALACAVPGFLRAQEWPQISLSPTHSGFSSPVHITHAGDGSGRIFVVELNGRIRVAKDGLVSTFLDISHLVGCRQGLLSVAFPPDYADKKHFYVNYTDGVTCELVIARFSLTNANLANLSSKQEVLRIPHSYMGEAIFHSGGELAFGPDGYLYVGVGDNDTGEGAGDAQNLAQNLNSWRGKILRLDVEARKASTYMIPKTNPFVDTPGARPEIWALGVRNPWRSSFDRATGDYYIADVGQNSYEEINVQPAGTAGGLNFGWPIMEGPNCRPPETNCNQAGLTPPVGGYNNARSAGDCSITGGRVYRGAAYPRMNGIYFYGDFCSGKIWGLRRSSGGWESALLRERGLVGTPALEGLVSFGEDENGNIYVADRMSGIIYMVTDTVMNTALVAVDDVASTKINRSVVVAVLANDTDGDGGTLSVTSAAAPTSGSASVTKDRKAVQYTPSRNFTGDSTFAYTISDGQGNSATASVTVTVTSR